ncbi:glycosyl hydrolase family 8 [Nibricoccus sp. IMCC34717]|uniref:glycosyl hydrolase family 8 n=1 Tax=Nibricoccus sp. IMCC34717 TaxID=3034021 RepID=UPI00384EDBE8
MLVSLLARARTLAACAFLGVGLSTSLFAQRTVPASGAFFTGNWSEWNLFAARGKTAAQISDKVTTAYNRIRGDGNTTSRLFYPLASDPNQWFVVDHDAMKVYTEGQSWGMMMALQMDDQPTFNKLWKFAKYQMQYSGSAPKYYYFRWKLKVNGSEGNYSVTIESQDDNAAPDGDIWIAAALMLAKNRWGDGTGDFAYSVHCNNILRGMLETEAWLQRDGQAGSLIANMFGSNNQVVFVPDKWKPDTSPLALNEFTDPSYHLPAFFEMFSRWASANNTRWSDIASTSRTYLLPRCTAMHSSGNPNDNGSTYLPPFYSKFDGTKFYLAINSTGDVFSSDAWRVASNVGVDYMWWGGSSATFNYHKNWANNFLNYLRTRNNGDYPQDMQLNGTAIYPPGTHAQGIVGMNSALALAASTSQWTSYVDELWNASQPQRGVTGNYYYNSCLYMLGLLQSSGNFRVWAPAGGGNPTPTPTPTPTPSPTPTPGGGTNPASLAPNSGFESGAFTNWQNWGNAAETTDADAGSKAMRVGTNEGGFGQNFNYTQGGAINISIRAKISGSPSWAGVGVRFQNSSGSTLLQKEYTVTSTAYATFGENNVTAPSGTTQLQVYGWKSGTAGNLFADNYVITSATPTSIIPNSGFESGAFTNWQNWGNSAETSDAASGTKAIVTGTGQGGFGQIISYTQTGTVNIKIKAKVSASPSWAGVGIRFKNSSGTVLLQKEYQVTATSYTQYGENNVTIPSGTTQVEAYGWKNGTTGNLFADDFEVTKN